MMPTDLTKPNAKQILRHHTDAISTVFVERRKYTSSTTTVLHFCMMPTDLLGICSVLLYVRFLSLGTIGPPKSAFF